MSAVRHQRVTIFADDDVTPLVGSVDINGLVTDPTCSTDSAHARPYLLRALELSGATVDFINGSSTIGQMNIEILDKRLTASDQTTGWFTNLLASAGGIPQISGRRILFEQQDTNGTWYVVLNGIAGDVRLKPDYVTYTLPVRDMRERERNMRLFSSNSGTVTALPIRGSVNGWGRLNGGSRYVIQPATPLQAKFHLESGTGGLAGVAVFLTPAVKRGAIMDGYRGVYATNWVNEVTSFEPDFTNSASIEDAMNNSVVKTVEIWWRASGSGGAWTVLNNLRRVPTSVWTAWGCLFQPWMAIDKSGRYRADTSQKDQAISMLSPDDAAKLPANGAMIELLVVMRTVPSESEPLLLEMSFGQLLKNIYDGVYSPAGTLPVKYDSAAMTSMVTNTPTARVRITETVNDARTWVEDNIYKPLGYAPLLNNRGEIKPVKYTLPDATVTLPQLDNTNIVEGSGEWLHSAKAAVTKVVFKYVAEILSRNAEGDYTTSYRDMEVVNVNAAASIFGNQTVEYAPVTVRTLIDSTAANSGAGGAGEWIDDLGGRLARERAADLINRFSYGAQQVRVNGQRSDPVIAALVPGDWVLLASSWMPEYGTRKRGANRVCQVISIQDTDPATRSIEILDGGPGLSPVTQPTVSSATYNTGTGCVDVAVTTAASVEARIDFAVNPTMPTQTSGLWTYAGRLITSGTLSIYDISENVVVWIRVRGEADNRRPSAWTTPVSVAIPIRPRVFNLQIALKDDSDPIIYFEKSASCGGVRIQYAVFGQADAIPTAYTTYGDASAVSPITLTGVRVNQFSRILVRVQGYEGFSAGVVTGAAGATAQSIAQRVSATLILPEVKEVRSQTTTDGMLEIESVYDPQFRLTKYEFRSKEGDLGAWSAWAEDTTDPYSTSVLLVEAETSIIEYRVSALDMDGIELVVASGSVGYYKGETVGFAECRARVTAATATQITVDVDGISPNGGTPTVQLVAITGSTALVSGAAIGSPVASGSQWVFSRGAALGGNGQTQFRATQSGGVQSDDDFVEIPEQGRDTTYVATRARVLATSPTTVTIRVAVVDPYPQGVNSASIAHVYQISTGAGTVDKTSPQTCTPESTFTENAGTYVDYVVNRPAFATGTGRITFTASAAGRVSDADAVDIPAIEQDTTYVECRAAITSVSATQITVTVSAVCTLGTPTVGLVGVSGSVSLASGHAAGTYTYAQNGVDNIWVFNRGAFQSGIGQVQFRAIYTGAQSDDDFVDVADQGRDTTYTECRATITAVSATQVTVTVTGVVLTGTPTVGLVGVIGAALASGHAAGTYTYAQNGTDNVWVFNRPAFGAGQGQAQFRAVTNGAQDDDDFVEIPEVGRDTVPVTLRARVISVTASTIVARVALADPYPQGASTGSIAWVEHNVGAGTSPATPQTVTPEATITEAAGTYVDFTITRPAFGTGAGRVTFTGSASGRVSDSDAVDVPEVGRDTVNLVMRARVTSTNATTVVVRVAVADPYPQGAASATIAYQDQGTGGVSPASGGTVTPAATLTEAAGTYIDYTITRPGIGTGTGRVTFTATASSRMSDSDAVDIPAQEAIVPECRARVTATTATQIQVTVDGVMGGYSPTVHLVAITGSATLYSGPAVGATGQASGTVWVFNRGAALGGNGQVQFRATLGSQTDDDFVEIPEIGRDTVNLVCAASLYGTQSETATAVRVTVTDPVPMGGTPYTLTVAATGCTVSPNDSASLANGGTRDFTITRPAAGSAAGRVIFTVSASGRTSDIDVVDVPAVAVQHAVFRMKLRKIAFASGTYTVEVDVYKYDGGGTWTQIKSWTSIGPGLGVGTANCREFGSTTDITVTETTPGYGYEQYPFIWTFSGSQSKEYVFNATFAPNASIAWGSGALANQDASLQITIPAMTNLVTVSTSTPSGSGTDGQFWAQI